MERGFNMAENYMGSGPNGTFVRQEHASPRRLVADKDRRTELFVLPQFVGRIANALCSNSGPRRLLRAGRCPGRSAGVRFHRSSVMVLGISHPQASSIGALTSLKCPLFAGGEGAKPTLLPLH